MDFVLFWAVKRQLLNAIVAVTTLRERILVLKAFMDGIKTGKVHCLHKILPRPRLRMCVCFACNRVGTGGSWLASTHCECQQPITCSGPLSIPEAVHGGEKRHAVGVFSCRRDK